MTPYFIHIHLFLQSLVDTLKKSHLTSQVNDIDVTLGRAPIHSIIHQSPGNRKLASDLLLALLTYSEADVNLFDREGRTPLHIAVEVCLNTDFVSLLHKPVHAQCSIYEVVEYNRTA